MQDAPHEYSLYHSKTLHAYVAISLVLPNFALQLQSADRFSSSITQLSTTTLTTDLKVVQLSTTAHPPLISIGTRLALQMLGHQNTPERSGYRKGACISAIYRRVARSLPLSHLLDTAVGHDASITVFS